MTQIRESQLTVPGPTIREVAKQDSVPCLEFMPTQSMIVLKMRDFERREHGLPT